MQWTETLRSAVLIGALAAAAHAQPAPRPLSVLDVPFISQSEALCGGAAAAMVLRYWGERTIDAESFAHLVDRSAAGIRTDALVTELQRRGWNAAGVRGSDDRIAGELGRGRPVLTLIEDRPGTYHYIVIVATTERAIVFHDPARAPLRVMSRDEFAGRWSRAGRWMAIVVPRAVPAETSNTAPAAPTPVTACEALIAEGVARAQANDLAGAERSLAQALACPGPAATRELAGIRLLQRRWPEVEALATEAVRADPRDQHAWRLLGTSRFVQNDPIGALDAWNHVGEPRVDLVVVAGLERTRQRSVEQLIGTRSPDVLTTGSLVRARRRLDELPAALSTRLDYAPVPSGLAEVHATVNERPLLPSDVWSYAAIGLTAAAGREVNLASGSLTGSGESMAAGWRFWPDRPRVGVRLDTPGPWGAVWTLEGFRARETFDRAELGRSERGSATLAASQWVGPAIRLSIRGGLESWEGVGSYAAAGLNLRAASENDRVEGELALDLWRGDAAFSRFHAVVAGRSSRARAGTVVVGRGGFGAGSGDLPLDVWFGGDAGHVRQVLSRAHPLLDEGRLRTDQLGRGILHGSVEVQRWWPVSLIQIGGAAFLDSVRTFDRLESWPRSDVDVGVGVRLAVPGVRGVFRADVARGLRDGAGAFAFVYEP